MEDNADGEVLRKCCGTRTPARGCSDVSSACDGMGALIHVVNADGTMNAELGIKACSKRKSSCSAMTSDEAAAGAPFDDAIVEQFWGQYKEDECTLRRKIPLTRAYAPNHHLSLPHYYYY